jgi:hypothetical protein
MPWCDSLEKGDNTTCKSRSDYDAQCFDALNYRSDVGDDWPFYLQISTAEKAHVRYPFTMYDAMYHAIEQQPARYLGFQRVTVDNATRTEPLPMKHAYMPSISCPDCDAYSGPYMAFSFNVTTTDKSPNPMFPGLSGETRARTFISPNQVLVGPRLTTERTLPGRCTKIPYAIESLKEYYRTGTKTSKPGCFDVDKVDTSPFGYDATFMRTSELYRDSNQFVMTDLYRFYNRTTGERFYYTGTDADEMAEFWALRDTEGKHPEVYSDEVNLASMVPYGFFYDSGSGSDEVESYPVYFDINMNSSRAAELFTSLVDGQYLNENTRKATMEMVLFNPELGSFAYVQVQVTPDTTGGIALDSSIALFDADLYDFQHNPADMVRIVFEVLLAGLLFFLLFEEVKEFVERHHQGHILNGEGHVRASMRYFGDVFNMIDLTSYVLLLAAMGTWVLITVSNVTFWDSVALRFELYANTEATGRFFELAKGPSADAVDFLSQVAVLSNRWSKYVVLCGSACLILVVQILKNLDFHPKMGMVTKTFFNAATDLAFFFALFASIHTIFSFVGCLIFGNNTAQFADIGAGWLTTLQMLIGNYFPQDDMGQDVWTTSFFWFYTVLVNMLLLNALLAIVLGAYDTVKADGDEILDDDLLVVIWREHKKDWRAGPLHVDIATLQEVLHVARDSDAHPLKESRSEHGPTAWLNVGTKAKQELEAVAARLASEEHECENIILVKADEITRRAAFINPPMVHDQTMLVTIFEARLGCSYSVATVIAYNMLMMYGHGAEHMEQGSDELEALMQLNKLDSCAVNGHDKVKRMSCSAAGCDEADGFDDGNVHEDFSSIKEQVMTPISEASTPVFSTAEI